MVDYGIKVMKAGYGVTNSDIRNILMSSKYPMFKYFSDNSGSVTFNPGDSHKYIDFTHNLGYVPAYISYFKYNGVIFNINATGANGPGGSVNAYSWADTTKVRAGFIFDGLVYGQRVTPVWPATIANVNLYDEDFGTYGSMWSGKWVADSMNGAIRFPNLSIAQSETIVSASLHYIFAGQNTTGHLRIRTRGIDEDNTADFTSNPLSRPQTTAYTDNDADLASNDRIGIDVKSIIQEVTTRGGWSTNNAIGFFVFDNSSDNDAWAFEVGGGESYLETISGSPMNVEFRVIIFTDKVA